MIQKLNLKNFRNYENEKILLTSGNNIFFGLNGQGKTNILEGIYYLLTGKSYKAQRDQELIRWGQTDFHIFGEFNVAQRPIFLESHYVEKRKIIKINQVPCKKLSDYLGTINVIYFSPDDLFMIKGGPLERRRFLDFHIAQRRPSHISLINSYNKVIQQKGALLRTNISTNLKIDQLRLWNEQLLMIGEKIIKNRWELTERLNSVSHNIYTMLSNQKEKINLIYISIGQEKIEKAISKFSELLEEKMMLEIERQIILIGPHRDDLRITLNDKTARHYASQGQQRSIVLSLKLAELEIIREDKGEYPLLLLDDVLSELDSFRREYLIEFINSSSIQTLMTMTSADEAQIRAKAGFKVHQGQIRREY
ncbi:MAG: DNA replication/repair protein RecF [Desulfitobacteriaceae bacterium]